MLRFSNQTTSSPLPSISLPQTTSDFQKPSSPSSTKINPAVLLVIVILAIIFFICGLLHLLVRFLVKTPIFSSISQSNRYPEASASGSHPLQRQLQQLFRLHDSSGLDQSLIDALPMFRYEDIIIAGSEEEEPFDCAVCLCEFSRRDNLRLLPFCSHAFHVSCIDTWLLSNSTCPLCRGTLIGNNPLFGSCEGSMEEPIGDEEGAAAGQESSNDKSVLTVRLGKLRSLDEGEGSNGTTSNMDARRCYSMGSFQYVVGDVMNLNVRVANGRGHRGDFGIDGDMEGKKIGGRSRGESFSVSKIWLWGKNEKFTSSTETHLGTSSLTIGMPMTNTAQIV